MRGALSPSLKAVGQGEYLRMWIDAHSNIADASEKGLNAETEEEGGIAAQLYSACVDVLKDLKIIANSRSGDSFSPAPSNLPTPTVSRLCSINKNATVTVDKRDKSLKCANRVASANPVKHTHGSIEITPRTFNIRADGDDDGISDTIFAHGDLIESSQRVRTSGTIARLKSSGQRSMKDALGKLFLWGEGLMDGGLERALGESDELRDHVLESLCGIAKILQRRLLPLVAVQPPQEALQRRLQDLDSLMDHSTLIISHDSAQTSKPCDDIGEVYFSESDVSYDGGNSDGEISDAEMHHRRVLDIGNELQFRTQCLMDLLPSLEQNIALVESYHPKSSIPTVPPFTISTPAHTYVSLLRDKYRNADEALIERLGEANWQRHLFVRAKIEQIADGPNHEQTTFLEAGATIFHDSGIGTTISGPSQYAASATSHTSFISRRSEVEKGSMRVPPTPKEITAREPFRCNFCGLLQSELRNRVDWKMHVFADIRPYICTFTSCTDQLTAFPTRQLWAEHEFRKHRMCVYWECPECEGEYSSPKTLEIHLDESHGCVVSGSKRSLLVSTAHRTRQSPIKDQKCPLCMDAPGTTRRAFVSHLTRHMEEIALLALPREAEADSEADSEIDLDLHPSVNQNQVSYTNSSNGVMSNIPQNIAPVSQTHQLPIVGDGTPWSHSSSSVGTSMVSQSNQGFSMYSPTSVVHQRSQQLPSRGGTPEVAIRTPKVQQAVPVNQAIPASWMSHSSPPNSLAQTSAMSQNPIAAQHLDGWSSQMAAAQQLQQAAMIQERAYIKQQQQQQQQHQKQMQNSSPVLKSSPYHHIRPLFPSLPNTSQSKHVTTSAQMQQIFQPREYQQSPHNHHQQMNGQQMNGHAANSTCAMQHPSDSQLHMQQPHPQQRVGPGMQPVNVYQQVHQKYFQTCMNQLQAQHAGSPIPQESIAAAKQQALHMANNWVAIRKQQAAAQAQAHAQAQARQQSM